MLKKRPKHLKGRGVCNKCLRTATPGDCALHQSIVVADYSLENGQDVVYSPTHLEMAEYVQPCVLSGAGMHWFVHLRLAASGNAAVRGRSVTASEVSLTTAESSSSLTNSGDLLVLHLNQSAGGTVATLLCGLLVGSGVEGEEEDEVRAENGHTSKGGKLLTGADTHVGHVGEVSEGEVGVRGEVDEAEVDDELENLHDGDVLLPPDADATCGLEVVPVHDDVDGQVQGNGDP